MKVEETTVHKKKTLQNLQFLDFKMPFGKVMTGLGS